MFRRGPDIKDNLEEYIEGCAGIRLDKYILKHDVVRFCLPFRLTGAPLAPPESQHTKTRAWGSGHCRKPLPVIMLVVICHKSSFSGVSSPTRPARRAASSFTAARVAGESSVAMGREADDDDAIEPNREVRIDWRVSTLGMARKRLDQNAA